MKIDEIIHKGGSLLVAILVVAALSSIYFLKPEESGKFMLLAVLGSWGFMIFKFQWRKTTTRTA